ncbi:MarR family transcriptional regulator [Microbacterium limosum]|uniref:MarR family transcriptional regulator n=1 Tax=Microbacterium limosum TaxID=3079935 RepID=A0AAU0MHP0_9MICO|nr:MarR family transcriptional regulator [Microbacterium sp. Y20]WOQ69982.1 MarR family transcriptional regulator [Microbacterium sp. Y20]
MNDDTGQVRAALAAYRAAAVAADRAVSDTLGVGQNDLAVVRLLLDAEGREQTLTPRDVALALGISTASTTALIDRLESAGVVAREPNPRDRRSLILRARADAASAVRAHVFASVDAERAVVDALSPEHREVLLRALGDLTAAADDVVRRHR